MVGCALSYYFVLLLHVWQQCCQALGVTVRRVHVWWVLGMLSAPEES